MFNLQSSRKRSRYLTRMATAPSPPRSLEQSWDHWVRIPPRLSCRTWSMRSMLTVWQSNFAHSLKIKDHWVYLKIQISWKIYCSNSWESRTGEVFVKLNNWRNNTSSISIILLFTLMYNNMTFFYLKCARILRAKKNKQTR